MHVLFFGIFFVAFLFFIWAGRQFDNSTFLIVGGAISILLAFFVFGSCLSYDLPVNQTMNYSSDYFKFLNASTDCANCSTCANTTCYGVVDCSGLSNEIACQACDQCEWNATGLKCSEIVAGASCNNSGGCLHCPGCSLYEPQTCCETNYNLTVGGSVTTSSSYLERALTETQQVALALFFALVGLYILIIELVGIIGSKSYNRRHGIG